jgi:hypothetical protein
LRDKVCSQLACGKKRGGVLLPRRPPLHGEHLLEEIAVELEWLK